jgi:hypothetical protein
MHMLSEFYLLFHHNHISASEVGTILIAWNLQGNESFKKEI